MDGLVFYAAFGSIFLFLMIVLDWISRKLWPDQKLLPWEELEEETRRRRR